MYLQGIAASSTVVIWHVVLFRPKDYRQALRENFSLQCGAALSGGVSEVDDYVGQRIEIKRVGSFWAFRCATY